MGDTKALSTGPWCTQPGSACQQLCSTRYATVGPLPELVKNDGEVRYSSMSYMDIVKRFFAAKLGGRGHVESLKSS